MRRLPRAALLLALLLLAALLLSSLLPALHSHEEEEACPGCELILRAERLLRSAGLALLLMVCVPAGAAGGRLLLCRVFSRRITPVLLRVKLTN